MISNEAKREYDIKYREEHKEQIKKVKVKWRKKNKNISFTPIEVNIILDLLNNNPISGLRRCKRIGCTYSTYSKSINKLQGLGILVFKKQGRTNNMRLTEIGNDLSVQLNIIRNLNI